MEQSILKSTKQMLHIAPDDDSFDVNVITFINSAFSTLNDAGIGPILGFVIEDDAKKWEDYIADDDIKLSKVKDYVQLHVRLKFDPPTMPHLLSASNEQLQELLWRLNVNRENLEWEDPDPPVILLVEE